MCREIMLTPVVSLLSLLTGGTVGGVEPKSATTPATLLRKPALELTENGC